MGLVYPSAAIARRWTGALEARLKRVPLERFLCTRDLVPTRSCASQDTDNVTRATVSLIQAGLGHYFLHRSDPLTTAQQGLVGHMACITSRSLAGLISQPNVWRIAALLSTTRLLSHWMNLNEAAQASAACVRQFQQRGLGHTKADIRIAQAASSAVRTSNVTAMADFASMLAAAFTGAISAGVTAHTSESADSSMNLVG